jgi:hypothetical protein
MDAYYNNPSVLRNEKFNEPINLSQLLYRVCNNGCVNDDDESIKVCMADNYRYISTLNTNAPFRIKRGEEMYYLWFQCREYNPASYTMIVQNGKWVKARKMQQLQTCSDWFYGPCKETGLDELVYWDYKLNKKLDTRDTLREKPKPATIPTKKPKGKENEKVQDLEDIEITGYKTDNKKGSGDSPSTNVIDTKIKGNDTSKKQNIWFDMDL